MPAASALRAEKAIAERSRGAHPCAARVGGKQRTLTRSRPHIHPVAVAIAVGNVIHFPVERARACPL